MSSPISFLLLILILCFILPILSVSCPVSNFTCGNFSVAIQYPFFTNNATACNGVYLIQCINLTPMVQLNGIEFMYPLFNIYYPEKTLIIHDLKLSLSPYPWGLNCVFLYDFKIPISRVNVPLLSQRISSNGSFFSCSQKNDYDFSHSVFGELYNSSSCKNYNLYYTDEMESRPPNKEDTSSNCSNSGTLWFNWKLSFKDAGGFSLISAGFSRNWVPDINCFDCRITSIECESGDELGDHSKCHCSRECQGTNIGKKMNIIIAGVIAAAVGLILACVLCLLMYRHCNRHKNHKHPPSTPLIRSPPSGPSTKKEPKFCSIDYPTHVFRYNELQEATNDFDTSQELGDGGFGTVYKGKLDDGRIVAVKRLYDNNYKRVGQFINEVAILSRLRHHNLVTLYGCTSHHSPELLLVYEFVSNGTLADHLHGPRSSDRALTWPRRLNIAIETATALAYLHAIEPPIIHRDVKTTNILLGNNFQVKVADFGLSRLFPVDATHVSTAPQGTPGYLDPEYHQCYQLTNKSDVYSFGVVLVELISSKQAVDITRHRNEINLASWALNKIRNKEMDQLVDPGLGYESDCVMTRMITMVAELAFRCLQLDRDMRPSIKEVLEELSVIESNGYNKSEKAIEEAVLLKSISMPFSPDSVNEKWVSSSSTLSNGTSGTI